MKTLLLIQGRATNVPPIEPIARPDAPPDSVAPHCLVVVDGRIVSAEDAEYFNALGADGIDHSVYLITSGAAAIEIRLIGLAMISLLNDSGIFSYDSHVYLLSDSVSLEVTLRCVSFVNNHGRNEFTLVSATGSHVCTTYSYETVAATQGDTLKTSYGSAEIYSRSSVPAGYLPLGGSVISVMGSDSWAAFLNAIVNPLSVAYPDGGVSVASESVLGWGLIKLVNFASTNILYGEISAGLFVVGEIPQSSSPGYPIVSGVRLENENGRVKWYVYTYCPDWQERAGSSLKCYAMVGLEV